MGMRAAGHGVIIEGTFTTTADGILRVRDMQGRLYVERPAPGDDAQQVARKLLREKCGYSPFHAPIRYPRSYHQKGRALSRGQPRLRWGCPGGETEGRRGPRWPSEIGFSPPLIYVSRTEISCTSPQCGHLTLSVAFQAARRLCTSVSIPVGACWCVVGQVKNREAICGSFPCTGGSATGLSATGA